MFNTNHETLSAILNGRSSQRNMGNCVTGGCCCCGSSVDAESSEVKAYILTTQYIRHGEGYRTKYTCPQSPTPVYARGDTLYFGVCECLNQYPLRNINSVDVVRGATILVGDRGLYLDPGVRIKGSDRTTIAFTTPNAEVAAFVHQLKSAVELAKGVD